MAKKEETESMVGKKLPKFKLEVTPEAVLKHTDLKGEKTVLFFYPKDNTPGCTQEGKDFTNHYRKFRARKTKIFGISRESIASHMKFIEKFSFPFELISDPEEELCEAMGVMKMKNMYGKKFRGIERSTFIVDETGKIVKEWRKVKVPGHVDEVLEALKELGS